MGSFPTNGHHPQANATSPWKIQPKDQRQARNDLVALTQLVPLADTIASDGKAGLVSTMADTDNAILAATAQRPNRSSMSKPAA
jgi:hypothetical protein